MNHIYEQPQFGENWFTYPNLYSRFVKELSSGSKIVEVGSWKGKSVAYLGVEIINSGKDIKVDAIDTWGEMDSEKYHTSDVYVKTNTLYQLFLGNISSVSSVVTPIRMTSLDAAKLYEDESIDVVFIDACHEYQCVKDDIAAWFPKVKRGGYVSGHDYPWSGEDAVKRAVDESIPQPFEVTEGCWVYRKEA
jgi:hypothetical protein